jgi:hypothetical protein
LTLHNILGELPSYVFALVCVSTVLLPPGRSSCPSWSSHPLQVPPPSWHGGISPNLGWLADGVGGQNTVPEANIPEELLPNARPGTLYGVSVDWWTSELGVLGTGFPGVPFNWLIPLLVGMLLVNDAKNYILSVVYMGPQIYLPSSLYLYVDPLLYNMWMRADTAICRTEEPMVG